MTVALTALHGALAVPQRRRLVGPQRLSAPLALARAQVTSLASALGADGTTLSYFGADVPRFNGTARRLLIGGQRINLITNSNDIAGTGWVTATTTGGTVTTTANAATAPDGTLTAALVTVDRAATSSRAVREFANATTGAGAHAATVYLRAATAGDVGKVVAIQQWPGTGNPTATISHTLTANWVRVGPSVLTHTAGSGRALLMIGYAVGVGSTGPTSFHAWGAQSEQAPFASSLIPTAGAAATRGADLVTASFASLFPAGAGTILWSGVIPQAAPTGADQILFQINGADDNNRVVLRNVAGGSTVQLANVVAGTPTTASLGSMTPGTAFAAAMAFTAGGRVAGCLRGAAVQALNGGPGGPAQLRLGGNVAGQASMFGETLVLDTLPYAVPDATLPALAGALPL